LLDGQKFMAALQERMWLRMLIDESASSDTHVTIKCYVPLHHGFLRLHYWNDKNGDWLIEEPRPWYVLHAEASSAGRAASKEIYSWPGEWVADEEVLCNVRANGTTRVIERPNVAVLVQLARMHGLLLGRMSDMSEREPSFTEALLDAEGRIDGIVHAELVGIGDVTRIRWRNH